MLEAGRRDFLDATRGVSEERALVRLHAGAWSVVECVEHVILAEERYLGFLVEGGPSAVERDLRRELRLFTMIRSRLTPLEAPEVFWPRGRFASLGPAVAEFGVVRDRSVRLAEEYGEGICGIGGKHPRFGELNGAEFLQLIDGHARRHAEQIREIGEKAEA